jgi:hypothetical protein
MRQRIKSLEVTFVMSRSDDASGKSKRLGVTGSVDFKRK